ncbi:heavy metal translocating P-type ATPase [Aquipseudomonas alcaligenes]|uniref:P-type Zn(2+) transporter n=1 Tax=Aquipseudomonas alcaligenes TaxID=43263 RepID=A0A2V4KZC7_AQUAC|nr:heavy metal translocating P-type ATPase [Pseudomonas alcaligenes]PYC22562.1 heavy metal translocating P-type ATPase [Pseudomonas alcaligenes]
MLLPGAALLVLAVGLVLSALGHGQLAATLWNGSALLAAVLLLVEILARLRRREIGVDLIALLAIATAVLFGQALVAALVALMLASGRALESYSGRRAEHELRRLIDRAPRMAWRYRDSELEQVPVEHIQAGDRLLVRLGEMVPVDGVVLDNSVTLDESALTGEPLPVRREPGDTLRSGALNAGTPFEMRASHPATQSTYAAIVRMVEAARLSRAPFVRLADRYALLLIPVTLALAGIAWLISGDPLRVLAVLVVATPCPLILAVPIAIMSGISRCAHRGILIKDGATLEALARARRLFLDKTGTLTMGHVSVLAVESAGSHSREQLLRLAASLAQSSPHLVAQAIVETAQAHGLSLERAQEVREQPGAGLCGVVAGHAVMLGGHDYVAAATTALPWSEGMLRRMAYEVAGGSFIAIDGVMAGAVLFSDRLRLESPRALRLLRQAGIRHIVMLTGDRADAAQAIGMAVGVDEIHAGLSPAGKVAAIGQGRGEGTSLMVGDGINDAPALAAADVGIALGAGGTSASSEAAGVVLLVDRLDRVAEALRIARRSRAIAVQGVLVGMGLSLLAMLLAVAGYLPALAGAVVQEAIDLAVIGNALRALGAGWRERATPRLAGDWIDSLREEHAALLPLLERLRTAAEGLDDAPPAQAREELAGLIEALKSQLVPHEQADEDSLYPQLSRRLPGEDPLAALSHTHREIFRLVHLLEQMNAAPAGSSLEEIQRLLLRLDTLLSLHFAQEDELYHSLDSR